MLLRTFARSSSRVFFSTVNSSKPPQTSSSSSSPPPPQSSTESTAPATTPATSNSKIAQSRSGTIFSTASSTTFRQINAVTESPVHVVNAYSPSSFSVNGFWVNGPILLMPEGIFKFKVPTAQDITLDSLHILKVLNPRPDILIIGTGGDIVFPSKEIRDFCVRAYIGIDVMKSDKALATYNFLCEEGRHVVALLFPMQQRTPET